MFCLKSPTQLTNATDHERPRTLPNLGRASLKTLSLSFIIETPAHPPNWIVCVQAGRHYLEQEGSHATTADPKPCSANQTWRPEATTTSSTIVRGETAATRRTIYRTRRLDPC